MLQSSKQFYSSKFRFDVSLIIFAFMTYWVTFPDHQKLYGWAVRSHAAVTLTFCLTFRSHSNMTTSPPAWSENGDAFWKGWQRRGWRKRRWRGLKIPLLTLPQCHPEEEATANGAPTLLSPSYCVCCERTSDSVNSKRERWMTVGNAHETRRSGQRAYGNANRRSNS